MFDESAVEAMYLKGHQAKLTPALIAELRGLGIDLEKPLKPRYPNDVVHAGTRLLRRTLYGHLADDETAYRAMGEAVIEGFFATMIGKAMASVFKVIGFKKVIARLPATLARGNDFVKVTLAWEGDQAALLTVSDCEPHWAINLGVFERAFRHHFSVPGFKAELVAQPAGGGAVYRLSWPKPVIER